jgi:hypothetical protein
MFMRVAYALWVSGSLPVPGKWAKEPVRKRLDPLEKVVIETFA